MPGCRSASAVASPRVYLYGAEQGGARVERSAVWGWPARSRPERSAIRRAASFGRASSTGCFTSDRSSAIQRTSGGRPTDGRARPALCRRSRRPAVLRCPSPAAREPQSGRDVRSMRSRATRYHTTATFIAMTTSFGHDTRRVSSTTSRGMKAAVALTVTYAAQR